jgi:hypothetical protein
MKCETSQAKPHRTKCESIHIHRLTLHPLHANTHSPNQSVGAKLLRDVFKVYVSLLCDLLLLFSTLFAINNACNLSVLWTQQQPAGCSMFGCCVAVETSNYKLSSRFLVIFIFLLVRLRYLKKQSPRVPRRVSKSLKKE